MASRYDDELWELVPDDGLPAATHLVGFARDLGPAGRVLDVGCGDGRLSAELDAAALTLADVSPVALRRAAARLPEAAVTELDPDAPLPFPDGAFDRVVCTETVEHVRDVQLLLSEVRRVLCPGGELALSTPAHGRGTGLAMAVGGLERHLHPLSPHLRFFTRRSLRGLLEAMGFSVASLSRRGGTLLARATR